LKIYGNLDTSEKDANFKISGKEASPEFEETEQ